MIKLLSLSNPLYVGFAIQTYLQKKLSLDVIQTFLNQTSIPKKGFNPTFAVFRVVDGDSKVVAYLTFRSKLVKKDTLSCSSFSSISTHVASGFNVDSPIDKFHVMDFVDDKSGLETICDKICESVARIISFSAAAI